MSEETITEGQRRHLFALLGEAGIKNREDRLSFAREVLEIEESDLTSFTQLYVSEADDLIFAARSWKIIQTLRDLNGELLKESISKVRRYYNYSRDEDVADIAQDDTQEASEASESDSNEAQDKDKPVRRPRRSGKAPAKKKAGETKESSRSKRDINEKSRTHSGRSSKTRSGSFSSEEIGYDLD